MTKESIKTRVSDQFIQEWKSDLFNSPKGITYRIFKEEFHFEDYLDILGSKDRILFTNFRTTNHKLPIETGRWGGIERSNRKCSLCNRNEIGDEFHYIFDCNMLRRQRNRYLSDENRRQVNVLKMKKLFQSKDIIELRRLCKLIKEINATVSPP